MRAFLKGLAHLFVSSFSVAAVAHLQSGQPITSGNVLLPAAAAGVLAVGHAVLPSILER